MFYFRDMKKLILIISTVLASVLAGCISVTIPTSNCADISFELDGDPMPYSGAYPITGQCQQNTLINTLYPQSSQTLGLQFPSFSGTSLEYIIGINITDPTGISVGETYEWGSGGPNIDSLVILSMVYHDHAVTPHESYTYPDNHNSSFNGEVLITNFNQTNNLISGTFYFTGVNANGNQSVNITNGIFEDVPLTVVD